LRLLLILILLLTTGYATFERERYVSVSQQAWPGGRLQAEESQHFIAIEYVKFEGKPFSLALQRKDSAERIIYLLPSYTTRINADSERIVRTTPMNPQLNRMRIMFRYYKNSNQLKAIAFEDSTDFAVIQILQQASL
jgi:hypothetical protein